MKNIKDTIQQIEKGMNLAANLPDIMPDQADEQIKPVYKEVKQTLRVPIVNLIFRTLANYPDYLESVWKQLCPSFRTLEFEQAADELRRAALVLPVPDAPKERWENLKNLEKLRAFNDTIHYVLPKLLIIATAFEAATFGIDVQVSSGNKDQTKLPKLPSGEAEGTAKVDMVDPDQASEKVKDLFNSIKQKHGHPLVSSYFRGLANWPDFLEQAWNRLSPLVGSTDYEERKSKLIEQSEKIVINMAVTETKIAGLDEKQRSEVRAILSAFRLKFIPEMLLDATLIKAMLDGADEALTSRFSVAGA